MRVTFPIKVHKTSLYKAVMKGKLLSTRELLVAEAVFHLLPAATRQSEETWLNAYWSHCI